MDSLKQALSKKRVALLIIFAILIVLKVTRVLP